MRLGLVCLLAISCFGTVASAEPVMWDDLLRAVAVAGGELHKGEPRSQVLSKVEAALKSPEQSHYRKLAEGLAADLRFSIKRQKQRDSEGASSGKEPERFLMDSQMPRYTWRFTGNWQRHLDKWIKANPDDPAARLIRSDRSAIGRLIPYLVDRSPMRSFRHGGSGGFFPHVPRVCDMAIQLITYHSRCRWFNEAAFREPFHARRAEIQATATSQIKAWWTANKDKSVEEGIRAHYKDAGLYGKSWMAEQLIRLGDERKDPALREEGLSRLRELLRLRRNVIPEHAARVLARYGESALPTMMGWLQRALDEPGVYVKTEAVFYVVKHGGRESWELILKLARREKREGVRLGHSPFLPKLANLHSPKEPRWAVPVLGLLLDRTKNTGSRGVQGHPQGQSFSKADVATERIQKLTGESFGYRASDSQEKRTAAIRKAQEWWADAGKATWTLDAIDKLRAAGK